jgi:hypothetical protein
MSPRPKLPKKGNPSRKAGRNYSSRREIAGKTVLFVPPTRETNFRQNVEKAKIVEQIAGYHNFSFAPLACSATIASMATKEVVYRLSVQ